jgi:hypothetical protein
MDAGAGGAFPSVDAPPRRPPDRPRPGNQEAADRVSAQPGGARAALGNPPDLDLAPRVRPSQPDLGEHEEDRHRPERVPPRAGGAGGAFRVPLPGSPPARKWRRRILNRPRVVEVNSILRISTGALSWMGAPLLQGLRTGVSWPRMPVLTPTGGGSAARARPHRARRSSFDPRMGHKGRTPTMGALIKKFGASGNQCYARAQFDQSGLLIGRGTIASTGALIG